MDVLYLEICWIGREVFIPEWLLLQYAVYCSSVHILTEKRFGGSFLYEEYLSIT